MDDALNFLSPLNLFKSNFQTQIQKQVIMIKPCFLITAFSILTNLLSGSPNIRESLEYSMYIDGITLGSASSDWTDDDSLGGHELRSTNTGMGESLGAKLTSDYTEGNRTLSSGPRRSTWNLQGHALNLNESPYYFSFFAQTASDSSFQFEFGDSAQNRWMPLKVNPDGSVETGLHNLSESKAISTPGLWQAGTTYLVVAKFLPGTPDTLFMSFYDLSDPEAKYLKEPSARKDWQLSTNINAGIMLDRLIVTTSDSGVSFDELRLSTRYRDVIPQPKKPSDGDGKVELQVAKDILKPLATVAQVKTEQAGEWTHQVKEAGDYQVGMAWVEVLSGDNVLIEILKNNTELIKSFLAPSDTVTRFENRIEGLSAGDVLTVKMTPNGGSYRAGYQIAASTPIFDGSLPVFDIHDPAYGAVGDGVTDDFSAIQAAVSAAVEAGGGIVRFDGSKIYRSIGSYGLEIENLIELVDTSNIKVEGNGATVVLHPPDRLAFVKHSENIQVDGFVMTYDPMPYYQGIIDDINIEERTVDLTVPDRYEMPYVGVHPENREKVFFAFSFIPESPIARRGTGKHLHLSSSETIDRNPRKVRLNVLEKSLPSLRHSLNKGATEIVVPHPLYGHRGEFSIEVSYSSRVMVSNLLCRMMPHLGIQPKNNVGPITFSNVDLLMENPETELFWGWRGAYSVTGHNRWGFKIEDSEWHGNAMYDDVLAFFMRRQDIVSIEANTLNLEMGDFSHLFKIGDWVSIWAEGQTEMLGMSQITTLSEKKEDGTFDISLESLPAGTAVNGVAINEELYNRNTLIRNCKNIAVGGSDATTRIRTGGHFLDCHFDGFYLITEFTEIFHPVRARGLILENTYFGRNSVGRMRLTAAINPKIINCQLDRNYVFGNMSAEDIYFEGNEWLNFHDKLGGEDIYLDGSDWRNLNAEIIRLSDSSTGWVFGNSTRNGISTGLSKHVSTDSTSTLRFDYPPSCKVDKASAAKSTPEQ